MKALNVSQFRLHVDLTCRFEYRAAIPLFFTICSSPFIFFAGSSYAAEAACVCSRCVPFFTIQSSPFTLSIGSSHE